MFIGLHVKYRYSGQILMELEFSLEIFEKYSNIKFHENTSSRNRVLCGRREIRTDSQTVMTKLIVAFRNFANAPKTCF
jgi:hypothetical protein